jgi:hypothetical protein
MQLHIEKMYAKLAFSLINILTTMKPFKLMHNLIPWILKLFPFILMCPPSLSDSRGAVLELKKSSL